MLVYSICYAASYGFARFGWYYLSGGALLAAAGYLYYYDYHKSGNLIHLRGLFSAFWVGGQAMACLKLSYLQSDWNPITWVCFYLALAGFWLTYEFSGQLAKEHYGRRRQRRGFFIRPVYRCMQGLTLVSLGAFLFEVVKLKYVPLLVRGVPHAYSEFHISGVHYFTVSCVLVPSLAVLFFLEGGSGRTYRNVMAVVMALVALIIPLLCVSRFQLIFSVLVACFTFGAYQRRLNPWVLPAIAAALLPFYVILTIARSHDIAYLNGIFEMKNSQLPIFISQPYIYIANNYENFDCLVEALPKHTFGIRMLFPVWALTGLKFLFPQLISYPPYVTKTELTTVTLFYDAYYDFGILGVIVFACALGFVAQLLVRKAEEMKNPIGYLFYSQFGVYMMLSFFTTWFSNPTTWFYLAVTGVMAIYCDMSRG
ncbi:MAG: oligosaccharide repeat unit polymerase [Hungatella sp.]|jgi:oligosaccharide repeat unit polymerase|nr:oligosaccharide repeat unit polymerase [Hungatella sp.]MCI9501983.1 oligosaccharide repeat unit polymerase [Hungatella sp.]MCI9637777.1 oligosaccharide repeat unit polymerase [Hungatella sp.]